MRLPVLAKQIRSVLLSRIGFSGFDFRISFSLLDINMKGMNGLEVLAKIRSMEIEEGIPEGKRVKIIRVTGNSQADTVKKCISKGGDSFVLNPITVNIIIEKLKQFGVLKEA